MKKLIVPTLAILALFPIFAQAETVVPSTSDIHYRCQILFPFASASSTGGGASPLWMKFDSTYPAGKGLHQFYDGYTKLVPFTLLQTMDTASFDKIPENAPKTEMFFVIGGYNQKGVESGNYYHEIRISAHSGDLKEAPFTGDQQGNMVEAYKFTPKTTLLGGARLSLDGTPDFKGKLNFTFVHPSDPKTVMNANCEIESKYTAPSSN
jgi:hypothetical protein